MKKISHYKIESPIPTTSQLNKKSPLKPIKKKFQVPSKQKIKINEQNEDQQKGESIKQETVEKINGCKICPHSAKSTTLLCHHYVSSHFKKELFESIDIEKESGLHMCASCNSSNKSKLVIARHLFTCHADKEMMINKALAQ